MKAQIENRISYTELEKLQVFVSILNRINDCESERDLREVFTSGTVNWYKNYFEWGFGRNHMWVHEKINGKVSDRRLIFVEF